MENNQKIREVFSKAFEDAFSHKEKIEANDLFEELENIDERYKKIRLLGEGAVKKVWLVKDILLDRVVTLAEIKSQDRDLANDFLKEARLASKLEHPSIAPIYDLGFTLEEKPFFVMKYYEGQTLREKLISTKYPLENFNWLLETFLKVCEAVSYAHSKQVLHLDIKPSNIRINSYGEVLLCDWGISKFFSENSFILEQEETQTYEIISRSTLLGEVRGTPGFMAPEQLTKNSDFCEQTDVYGLGALLCDLFTGSPPSKNLNSNKFSSCPSEIISIIKKATEPKINDRYQNVNQLINDIKKFQNGMVTIAEGANIFSIMKKWVYRNRKSALIIAINCILISIVILFYIQHINKSNSNLEKLVNQLQEAEDYKQNQRLLLSEKYYQQSYELYKSAISRLDFDFKDIQIANDLIIRSLELKPENHHKAWHLAGCLKVLLDDYQSAIESFKKGEKDSEAHLNIINNFLIDYQNHKDINAQIYLTKSFHKINDSLLRHSIIFKNIHSLKDQDLLNFAMDAMAIVHNLESLKWSYDKKDKSLDLSHNDIENLFPLRTLRISHLNLSHTNLRYVQLYNLRNIPLITLDLSYSSVQNLSRFENKEVRILNLEGSSVRNIHYLETSNVRRLNVYKISASLKKVHLFESLREITCSAEQAALLKESLNDKVKIIIKKD